MNEELQQRALEIAMRDRGVLRGGDLEPCREDLWLRLYEGLGWAEAAMVDMDLLVAQLKKTVEAEKLRAAGWSEARIETWLGARDLRELIEAGRPSPGESFDRKRWLGPLAGAISAYLDGPSSHPFVLRVDPADGPAEIEARLVALGATENCIVERLETLLLGLSDYGIPDDVDEGTRLPLRAALEIADETEWEAVLVCTPRRLAYVQHHEVGSRRDLCRALVYRPASTS